MFEILQYTFFQYALIAGICIAAISSVLWVFVVMRKEANITHSIANFLFLGIAISLLLQGNYYLYGFIFAIIGSLLLFYIEKTQKITTESSKEIISQLGIAWAIFSLWFLDNLQLDIESFLFWSILFIDIQDIIFVFILLVIVAILWFFFSKNFLAVILNKHIAKTSGIPVEIYNMSFLIILSIFIAISIKMFWIMLIGAFLIIPANIWKVLGSSIKQVFQITAIVSICSVIMGLFGSYFLDTSSGATIVLILISIFLISLIIKK